VIKNLLTDGQPWTIESAERVYGVNRWGKGYFSIGESGDMMASPQISHPELKINIREVVEEIRDSGIQFPAVIRFHDILRSQVVLLNETFNKVIKEAEYQGEYFGVFPIKVNQMREVVE
jgi:arginine decarboxylase